MDVTMFGQAELEAMLIAAARARWLKWSRKANTATERPTPLSGFARRFEDHAPAPIALKPWLTANAKAKAARAEFADAIRARTVPRRPQAQAGAYTLSDLDAAFSRCRYPTSDAPFLFCGEPCAAKGCSYCVAHAALCYRGRGQ